MTIYSNLLEIQTSLVAPKNQRNTFGNYNYRSCEDILEAVKPLLKAQGLALTLNDELVLIGERYYIKATATLSDGKETIEAVAFAREEETKKGMDGSQITGASSSYARKYALNGLFLTDDSKDSDATNDGKAQPKKEPAQKDYDASGDDRPISLAQLKRLFAITASKGLTVEALIENLKVKKNYDGELKAMPRSLYQDVCDGLEKMPDKAKDDIASQVDEAEERGELE